MDGEMFSHAGTKEGLVCGLQRRSYWAASDGTRAVPDLSLQDYKCHKTIRLSWKGGTIKQKEGL